MTNNGRLPAFSKFFRGSAIEIAAFQKLRGNSYLRIGASTLSGIFLLACFPNLNWNWLVWVACLPLLAAVVSERNLTRAFLMGYLSGAIFLAGSCYWFVYVLERYGGLSPTLAVGVLVLFLLVFSVFYGVFGLVEAWVAQLSLPTALALSPFLWVSLEFGRTYYVCEGFPWNLLGYAVHPIGLRQLASVTAVYGLSFLAVSSSALLAWTSLEPWRKWIPGALIAWVAVLMSANWIAAPSEIMRAPQKAYLVQPDVPLEEAAAENWAPWRDPGPLKRLISMAESAVVGNSNGRVSAVYDRVADRPALQPVLKNSPPLVIWSENPAPFYFDRDPIFRRAVEEMARQTRAYVVVGAVTFLGADDAQPQNSAIVLDPAGQVLLQYAKIHLVPFGEYVPAWAFPGSIGKITSGVGNYVPGSAPQVVRTADGTIGVFICYEAIFPQLVRRFVAEGAEALVNISNDTWFGNSSAAFQHLEMARLRAIENHRFLLRATNDGITAVIDPYGRVLARLSRHQRAVLPAAFSYLGGRTFYTAHGDVIAWLCVTVSLAVVARRILARRRMRLSDD